MTHDPLFQLLDPPPGGLDRMRAQLAMPSRGTLTSSASVGIAAVVALVALLFVGEHPEQSVPDVDALTMSPTLDRVLGRASVAKPLRVERNEQTVRTEQLQSVDPTVRIYQLL